MSASGRRENWASRITCFYLPSMMLLDPGSIRSPLRATPRLRSTVGALPIFCLILASCTTHHWAQVATSTLPPPPGPKVLHSSPLRVHVADATQDTDCVKHQDHHPVCYFNVRPAIEAGLVKNLWPAFPEVTLGEPEDAAPAEYVLEVDLELDALPPDASGPGWAAGVRGRYRLLRDGETVFESTLATRSRGEFPYGAPLGTGASEAMDAALQHIAREISQVDESRPDPITPLPRVASRVVSSAPPSAKSAPVDEKKAKLDAPSAARGAKSDSTAR
jgi:hypothetical protein